MPRINIIHDNTPQFINPDMMESNRLYKVWYGDSSDLFCMLDNNSSDTVIYFDGACGGVIYSDSFEQFGENGYKLEKTDLRLTVTIAPYHYSVNAAPLSEDI